MPHQLIYHLKHVMDRQSLQPNFQFPFSPEQAQIESKSFTGSSNGANAAQHFSFVTVIVFKIANLKFLTSSRKSYKNHYKILKYIFFQFTKYQFFQIQKQQQHLLHLQSFNGIGCNSLTTQCAAVTTNRSVKIVPPRK